MTFTDRFYEKMSVKLSPVPKGNLYKQQQSMEGNNG